VKVLVASSVDLASGAIRGEPVVGNPLLCPRGEEDECDCVRFVCLVSGKLTPVATVANLDTSLDIVGEAVREWAERVGFPVSADDAREYAQLALDEAAEHRVGTRLRFTPDGCEPL